MTFNMRSTLSSFVLWTTTLLLLCLRHTPYRTLILPVFPFVILTAIYIILNSPHGMPDAQIFAGGSVLLVLRASDFLFSSAPFNPFDPRIKRELPPPQTPLQILNWAISQLGNLRGVGWSYEVPGLNHPSFPRWVFVRAQVLRRLALYFVSDIIHTHNRLNPSFHPQGPSVAACGWMWRVWNTIMFWCTFWEMMEAWHLVFSAIAVALGINEPSEWPPLFGGLRELTGVRAFWGYVPPTAVCSQLLTLSVGPGEYGISSFGGYALPFYIRDS